ncbi:MAG: STAS domain-containing protein [Dehalococcoidia bacterium]
MENSHFEAAVRRREGTAIIELKGDVNAFAEETLNAAYAEATQTGPSAILLNFHNVAYINSTGIALIVGLLAQARKSQRRMFACDLSDHYREIFQITRLADFMDIFSDEASALAGAAAPAAAEN